MSGATLERQSPYLCAPLARTKVAVVNEWGEDEGELQTTIAEFAVCGMSDPDSKPWLIEH